MVPVGITSCYCNCRNFRTRKKNSYCCARACPYSKNGVAYVHDFCVLLNFISLAEYEICEIKSRTKFLRLQYEKFNGSHFGFPSSSVHRMTGLGSNFTWTMMYSHRSHWVNALICSVRACWAAKFLSLILRSSQPWPRHTQRLSMLVKVWMTSHEWFWFW